MSSIPELTTRLGDATVELRAISDWDIPEILIAHQDDPAMYKLLGMDKPPTGAQLGSQVERAVELRRSGTTVSLTIVEPGRDDCRGRISAFNFDWDAGSVELGVWVAPDRRGRGFATAALRLAADWLTQELGIATVTIVTSADNLAMGAAATAAGFAKTSEHDGEAVFTLSASS